MDENDTSMSVTCQAVRAYDPCLSCATHALGRMPLIVDLFDHEGNLLDRKTSAGEEHGFGAGFSSSFARQRPVRVRL